VKHIRTENRVRKYFILFISTLILFSNVIFINAWTTTSGGTVGSHLDVGIADSVTGTNRGTEFFNDLLLNNVLIYDSWLAGDNGTQTKWILCQDVASATDDWVVGQILDADASNLVGKYYIIYSGR